VPEVGLEPTRPEGHWILSPARLPVPPLRHRRGGPGRAQGRPPATGGFNPPEAAKSRRPKCLTHTGPMLYLRPVASGGAIAQLGERLHGMQEVRGSIPLGSTTCTSIRRQAAGSGARPGLFFVPGTEPGAGVVKVNPVDERSDGPSVTPRPARAVWRELLGPGAGVDGAGGGSPPGQLPLAGLAGAAGRSRPLEAGDLRGPVAPGCALRLPGRRPGTDVGLPLRHRRRRCWGHGRPAGLRAADVRPRAALASPARGAPDGGPAAPGAPGAGSGGGRGSGCIWWPAFHP
jgi:hypothetical protein